MASTKKTVLIIGSTRGIGLAFVEHYTKAGWNVICTARANSNTEKLKALGPFKVIAMDTSDEASILEAARQLDGQPIDLLINNAGIGIPCELETGTKDALMSQFEVNAVGPFLLASKANGGASVVQLSSLLGSIGSYTNDTVDLIKQAGFGYGYSGIVVVSVRPGYVDTDLTQGKATLKPTDSVAAMTGLIAKLNPESTGKFFNLDPQIPVAELLW
ncbi:NAD(P)-binding domain [Phytophthora cactorum]|nr:NAD(P)-binding domain [Phytophthora cactorum]